MTAYEQSPRRIPLWLFVTALLLILANIDPANAYKVPLTELDNLPTTLPYQPVFPSGQSQSRTARTVWPVLYADIDRDGWDEVIKNGEMGLVAYDLEDADPVILWQLNHPVEYLGQDAKIWPVAAGDTDGDGWLEILVTARRNNQAAWHTCHHEHIARYLLTNIA